MISAQIIYGLMMANWALQRTAIVNHLISTHIKMLLQQGVDVRTAFDQVLGEGSLDALASDLYDALRAKANKEI